MPRRFPSRRLAARRFVAQGFPRRRAWLAALVALSALPALAAPRSYALPEPTAELRPPADESHAAGFAAAQSHCMTCHSADYVAMQPPGKGRAFWEAEVTKMIKVYRAPIDEAEGKAIAAYLSAQY